MAQSETLLTGFLKLKVLGFFLLGVFIGGLVVFRFIDVIEKHHILDNDTATASVGGDEAHLLALDDSPPLALSIPSVSIDVEFEGSLGLKENGEIMVPKDFNKVGWYQYGPTPGEVGPSVVIGHLDSFASPAAFFNLRKIKVGEEILVKRGDGVTARFLVTETLTPDQDNFPTKLVYGDIDYPGLRLITCTGDFDKGKQRYKQNFVVFARLVGVSK